MKSDVMGQAAKKTPSECTTMSAKSADRLWKKRWRRVVTGLAAIVVFCTIYALILPAVTMEKELTCGLTEHQHTSSCYQTSQTLVSQLNCQLNLHKHTGACYDSDGNVKCGYADFVVHVHNQGCYNSEGQLICSLSEIYPHSHEESCFDVAETTAKTGHTHGAECYETTAKLVCQLEESSNFQADTQMINSAGLQDGAGMVDNDGHQHSDECYVWEQVLTCELAESAAGSDSVSEPNLICQKAEIILHTHTDACFDSNGNLICGQLQVLEHVHSENCFKQVETNSEPILICEIPEHTHDESLCYTKSNADVETADDWEKTLPEKLSGEWAVDLLVVAESQLGYTESTENVQTDANGRIKGYTRYGSWYGDPYGDWCAMFVSFCLNYADVEPEVFPYESGCARWITALTEQEMYASAEDDYEPKSGDIIFFENDGDQYADHVGIVAEVTSEYIKTIEGNTGNDSVANVTYEHTDTKILGFGILPQQLFICGITGHVHDSTCIDENGDEVCGFAEHIHTEQCMSQLSEEAYEEVLHVISLIDALPTADEVDAALLAYEEAEDWDGYEAYYTEIGYSGRVAYEAYLVLSEEQKAAVTNIDKLMELSYIWSAVTLIDEIESDAPTTTGYASTRDFIELNLYDYGPNINEKYNSNNKYPGFQWNGGAYLKDTYDRHTVDYIDFGNSMITDFEYGSSLSGSNGKSSNAKIVALNGGDINELDISDYGVTNRPIGVSTGTEVLKRTLGTDGYPALADGTSLSYLFKDGDYADKQNTVSIDGLFQQDPVKGEYHYNSRLNHAQYSNNQFTLYNQIITPNFIVYPFGNFLPLNDITSGSNATQVSKIKISSYVQQIIDNLNNSSDTTKKQLVEMLKKYKNDLQPVSTNGDTAWSTWKAADAIKDYFIGDDKYSDNPSDDTSPITDELLNKMYNIDWDVQTNFFFGMDMKMTFMQPKNGMTGNDTNGDGKSDYPMEFYFTGDDDVWVYIDDVLFLDLSGIHRHVGGKIDFVNGKVHYYALDTAGTGDVSNTPYKTFSFAEILTAAGRGTDGLNDNGTFKDYSYHDFNFYYMERGSGSSVCRLNFNFPLLKRNSISVSKELTVDEQDKLALLGNPDFKFQVLKANSSGNKPEDLFIGAGVTYTIYDESNIEIGTGATDENGVFSLKAGQRAEFADISEDAGKYYVRELLDPNAFSQYGVITVDGKSTTTSNNVTVGTDSFTGVNSSVKDASDGTTMFNFNNQIVFNQLGSLVIGKVLNTYPQTRTIPEFEFYVTLDGNPLPVGTEYIVETAYAESVSKTIETEGIVVVPSGSAARIEKIIAGTKFVVQETATSSAGYTVTYSGSDGVETDGNSASGTIVVNSEVEVTVTNSENGASVQIPVLKTMPNPDGKERTFSFTLEQVTDWTGETLMDGGTSQNVNISVKDTKESAFALQYLQKDIKSYPATFYYKISESAGSEQIEYDEAVYVVEVTVNEDEASSRVLSVAGDVTSDAADRDTTADADAADGAITAGVDAADGDTTADADATTDENMTAKITAIYKNGVKIHTEEIASGLEVPLEFVNVRVGELSLSKEVTGVPSDREFSFTIELGVGTSGLDSLDDKYTAILNHADREPEETQVSFTDGKLNLTMVHDESLTIQGIPCGAVWTVTETDAGGYHTSWSLGDGATQQGNVATGEITSGTNLIICINAAAYELPETGGTGTYLYTTSGLLLLLVACSLLLYKHKERKYYYKSERN